MFRFGGPEKWAVVHGLKNITEISCGRSHNAAIHADGKLVTASFYSD